MADADEDALPTTVTSSAQPNSSATLSTANPKANDHNNASPLLSDDDEDETADFRFLSSTSSKSAGQGLPKRGTKDFEPNPTLSQRNTLDASRRAMHDALSALRVHAAGKTHNVGVYVDWGRREEIERWGGFRGLEVGATGSKEWRKRCVVIYNFKGTHSKTVGRADRRGWTWLLPEEALYLVERGSLDARWPIISEAADEVENEEAFGLRGGGGGGDENRLEEDDGGVDEEEPPISELPMSLQGAYASFIGKSGLTLGGYLVYAALKRSGYIVQRAPTWGEEEEVDGHVNGKLYPSEAPTNTATSQVRQPAPSPPSLIHRLISYLVDPRRGTSNPCLGPLLAPGLYRNYSDVFRALALIPYHASIPRTAPSQAPKQPFTISYLIYKPKSTSGYRKSTPPSPDYRVCVVDARKSSVPTMTQIGDLLDSMPEDELQAEGKRVEAKIKHGRRNVIVGVVDMGVVSYLRFAETEIGRYRLYEEKMKRGGKGKGKTRPVKGNGKGQGPGRKGN